MVGWGLLSATVASTMGAVLFTEVCLCWWMEGKWPHFTLMSLKRGVCACSYSGSPHRRMNNLPLCVPGFLQNPVCVCTICLHGGTVFLCFISGVQLGFKTPNFRNLIRCKPTLILWRGSCCTVAHVSLFQKSSCMTVQGFSIYDKP